MCVTTNVEDQEEKLHDDVEIVTNFSYMADIEIKLRRRMWSGSNI